MLPAVDALIASKRARGLINTGCSQSVIAPWLQAARGAVESVRAVDGHEVTCEGRTCVAITVEGVT